MDSFKTLQDSISCALVSTTRAATRLSAADIPFQRSLDPEVATALDEQNARLLQLAQHLLETAASSSDAVGPKLPDIDAIDGNWRGIVDVVDSLLEKADTSLDEYTGVVKRLAQTGDQSSQATKGRFGALPKTYPKPQLSFEHVPKNNETGGFRPLLQSKPHAKVPLEECLKTYRDAYGREQYPHPYQAEIEAYKYPPSMYIKSEPQLYPPFESTTATLVDTPEALEDMLNELKTAKEIAIDLEHHDNRTYIGLVSLMQISTRNKDWIIDTLKPWRRRLECLNEVFANPNIIKVLHGAYMDIVWLQRDLGLYIVGLFDTYHAARALGYKQASLAFLLDKFVNFKAQKQHQMADWRIRPLSEELFDYARADTHFLLYIFDNMRNELIDRSDLSDPDKDKVADVLANSREVALQRYEHPVYDAEFGLGSSGWYKLISRTPAQYTPEQFAVFRAVHQWRDNVARAEDESPLFILPHHAVFSIARVMPADKAALFSIIQHVSPILRTRADELMGVIGQARAGASNAPDLVETLKMIEEKVEKIKYPEGRIAKPSRAAAPVTQSPGMLTPAPTIATLDTPPLRAPISTFWGSLGSNRSTIQQRPFSTSSVSLALPLPPLTAEVFSEGPGVGSAQETPQSERPEPTYIPKEERPAEDKRSDIFIVKQLGGKRKRGQVEAQEDDVEQSSGPVQETGEGAAADEIILEDDEAQRKKAAKEAKRLRKKERREQKALEQDAAPEEEEPAFDYTTAPSVLRAGEGDKDKRGKKKKDKRKSGGFNPYAKMTDAPKGLPRSQKESAGRSKTFTS